jgi:hypothetical protein
MIVVGLDVHKHSLTAVAVDELGRTVGEQTSAAGGEAVVGWALSLAEERLWAVEDCRQVTRRSHAERHRQLFCGLCIQVDRQPRERLVGGRFRVTPTSHRDRHAQEGCWNGGGVLARARVLAVE